MLVIRLAPVSQARRLSSDKQQPVALVSALTSLDANAKHVLQRRAVAQFPPIMSEHGVQECADIVQCRASLARLPLTRHYSGMKTVAQRCRPSQCP